jgi:excisionase family DNA binding protein
VIAMRESSFGVADGPRLLTTGVAARIAGCHPVTILRAIDAGELTALRLGAHGHYRISRRSLNAWLQPTNARRETR